MSGGEVGIHHHVVEFAGKFFNLDTLMMTWLVMAIVLLIAFLATRTLGKGKMPGNKCQNSIELLYEYVSDTVKENLDEFAPQFVSLIFTMFLFIFVSNMLGLIPGLASPTNDLNTTSGLALFVIILVFFMGFKVQGLGYLRHYITPYPVLLPLNIIEDVTKPLTLALRLFGNILAGEFMLQILYLFVPWFVPLIWLAFCVFIGSVQAFLFSMLTLAYVSMAIRPH